MKTVEVNPEMLSQYARMTKNEILLHLGILMFATESKLERNIGQMCRVLDKTEQRLRDAEYGLKRRGLLEIQWVDGRRYWQVFQTPSDERDTFASFINQIPDDCDDVPILHNWLKRLKYWMSRLL